MPARYRRAGQVFVRPIDEHRHRPFHRAGDQRQFLEHVPGRTGHVGQHDIGFLFGNAAGKPCLFGHHDHAVIAGRHQPVDDPERAVPVTRDDNDRKPGHH
jgi:hypothetical protein